jgi:Fe(3+) dicitrate transport protein
MGWILAVVLAQEEALRREVEELRRIVAEQNRRLEAFQKNGAGQPTPRRRVEASPDEQEPPQEEKQAAREAEKPAAQEPTQKPAQEQATEVLIIGQPERLERIPGSGHVIPNQVIETSRPRDVNELIRKVPGVHARDEEGFGMRPNYGVRGLNPTRSSKVLLLEDGVPFTIGPYGDNTTYYHPPVNRFERVEVLKGAGQILYGPNTVGAVFNYISPKPPTRPGGSLHVSGGTHGYLHFGGSVGAGTEEMGAVLDFFHKESDGRADDIHLELQDVMLRTTAKVAPKTTVSLKFNALWEDSQVTYAGLTESEFAADPRRNPFDDDSFDMTRIGAHGAVKHELTDDLNVVANLYGYTVRRDWWRQWHNGVNSNVIAATGTTTEPNNRESGRLREYTVYGVEPRFQLRHDLFGFPNETDFGLRAHYESQDRRTLTRNLPPEPGMTLLAPLAAPTIDEDNERYVDAYSGFLQNRFLITDDLTFSAGLRVEHVRFKRVNHLGGGGFGVSGEDHLTEWIPGVGINYLPVEEVTLFAGVHRGFAPPRVEDAIDNTTGASLELDPEESWNYELGARYRPAKWLSADLTFFLLDFENQIVPASVAGGGATLTNAGETLHRGLELGFNGDFLRMNGMDQGLALSVAYTWLPTARFEGTRFSSVTGAALLPGEPSPLSVTGNRLPYAPEHLLTLGLTYDHPIGLRLFLEGVYVGEQFSDDRETREPTPNGRRGLIDDSFIWNTTVSYTVEDWDTTFFVTVKNLFDEVYIVDRTRGIYAGMERQIYGGVSWRF